MQIPSLEESLALRKTIYTPRLLIQQHNGPTVSTSVDLMFEIFSDTHLALETITQTSYSHSSPGPADISFLSGVFENCPGEEDLIKYLSEITASSEYQFSPNYGPDKLIDGIFSGSNYWVTERDGPNNHSLTLTFEQNVSPTELNLTWYSQTSYNCDGVTLLARNPFAPSAAEEFQIIASTAQSSPDGATNSNSKLTVDPQQYIAPASEFRVDLDNCDNPYILLRELELKGFPGENPFSS